MSGRTFKIALSDTKLHLDYHNETWTLPGNMLYLCLF